jgi:hypothetical protein
LTPCVSKSTVKTRPFIVAATLLLITGNFIHESQKMTHIDCNAATNMKKGEAFFSIKVTVVGKKKNCFFVLLPVAIRN